jgi:O-antigen ligase
MGLSLKPVHVSVGAAFLAVLLGTNRRALRGLLLGYGSLFIWLYGAYLIWCAFSLIWAPDLSVAVPILVRNAVYFGCFLMFVLLVRNSIRSGSFSEVAGLSALLGVTLFALYMLFVFGSLGRNLVVEYTQAILKADTAGLMFDFYPVIFNASMAGGEDRATYLTSLRNTVMGGILVYLALIAIWKHKLKSPAARMVATTGIALCAFLVVTSVSRSNIIVLAMIIVLSFAIRAGYWRLKRRRTLWRRSAIPVLIGATGLVFVALLGTVLPRFPLGQLSSAALSIFEERVQAVAQDPRIVQFGGALTAINDRVLFGYGIGEVVSTGNGKWLRVHNFFLASWLETGLAGALLALAWYMALVYYLIREIANSRSWNSEIPKEWAIALLVLPLFRVLVSGSASFTLIEWLALALFFGLMQGSRAGESRTAPTVSMQAVKG